MLVLIDGTGLAYRIYFAFSRNPLMNSKGENTSAIYGFNLFLERLFKEWNISHLGVSFDISAPTFRHTLLEEYKATREKMPDDLKNQIPVIKEIVKGWGGCVVEKEGYEADDIIGTLSKKADDEVFIFSGDKDLMQLVNKRVKMVLLNKIKGEWQILDIDKVKEKMGVYPDQIVDYLLLVGDSSDNVPGVKGIGKKTAIKLLEEFGSIEGIINNMDKLSPSIAKKLEGIEDHVKKYKEILSIKTDVDIDITIDDLILKEKNTEILKKIGKEYEIRSLMADEEDDLSKNWKISDIVKNPTGAFFTDRWYFFDDNSNIVSNKCSEYDRIKYVQDKELYLKDIGIDGNYDDISLMSYMIHSEYTKYSTDILMVRYMDFNPDSDPLKIASHFEELYIKIKDEMGENLFKWYRDVELPLSSVLRGMEENGIKIDMDFFNKYNQRIEERIGKLENEIYELSGEKFNINSPKQLGKILFEKLNLPVIKRTKTGYSTDVEVLNKLNGKHPIIEKLLEYREIFKLYSTYLQPLPSLADENGRLHTSFHHKGTATGRLSSSNPNLQNIPEDVRKGFIAPDRRVLISADYSQIELRVLAHLSGDRELKNIFYEGGDIHTATACRIFGISPDKVNSSMRRVAKVVNYGIVYGMSNYGLSKEIGISVKEATDYINMYFEKFEGVKKWIDEIIKKVEIDMFVETITGRRRYIREIRSSNKNLREYAKRTAINTPVQGSAADIIKKAMVVLNDKLKGMDGNPIMLLQVHDELVIEVDEDCADDTMKVVKDTMENVFDMEVPIVVDIGKGKNWKEAH